LVARLPPIWQEPSEPMLKGNSRSISSAAFCTPASVMPASTTMELPRGSRLRMAFMRPRLTTTSWPKGICAPVRPVLPPCGTMAVPVSFASARMRETSSVEPGRSTSGVLPR
jgi:hypothetical protein